MADAVLVTLGQRVGRCRKRLGLTQAQLATLVGLTRASITNIEGGQQNPGAVLVTELAAALQVTPGMLLDPTEIPPPPPPEWVNAVRAAERKRLTSAVLAALDVTPTT